MARTTSLDTEIRSRIDSFLEELSALVKQSAVEAVREALGQGGGNGAATPARRGPGRPRGSGSQGGSGSGAGNGRKKAGRRASGGGGKRSAEFLDKVGEAVLAYVRSNPGSGAEAIGRELGLSAKEMALPIKKLLSEGQLRTEGQRRGTKYFAGGRGGGGGGGSGNGRRSKGARKAKAGRKGGRKGSRKKGARVNGSAATETAAAA